MAERYTCEQVIAALQKTKGMVYLAARELGCVHQTVYNYIERHATVKAAWQAEHGQMGDTTELKLYAAIMRDENWAIAFYLKTKGKDRGYSEKTEVELSGGTTTRVSIYIPDNKRDDQAAGGPAG